MNELFFNFLMKWNRIRRPILCWTIRRCTLLTSDLCFCRSFSIEVGTKSELNEANRMKRIAYQSLLTLRKSSGKNQTIFHTQTIPAQCQPQPLISVKPQLA